MTVEKKNIADYRKFITAIGVEESEGICLQDAGVGETLVQSVNFVHAPYEAVNTEFSGYSYDEYLLEIKLEPKVKPFLHDDLASMVKKTVEFRTQQSIDNKNAVNIYGDDHAAIILIATRDPEALMDYLETRNTALDKTTSNALKILHKDVWPAFKAKHTKIVGV